MFDSLTETAQQVMDWRWDQFKPYFEDLQARPVNADTVAGWLADWTHVSQLAGEAYARLIVATSRDTTDEEAEGRYHNFLDEILPPTQAADQRLKQKFLASGVEVAGFEVPARNMQAEADLFREANLPLLTKERKLASEFDKIVGAQTVEWEGEERTLAQLRPVFQDTDRAERERAWRLASERQLADREAINGLWIQFMDLRRRMAANAGYPDYRAFRWQQMLRFDYTPGNGLSFHEAIEQTVVPAAARIYEKRRARLGVERLRPWDLDVDPLGRPALRPFEDVSTLEATGAAMFQRVDPQLGGYFETMRGESLLDLDNRKGKAPGGFCISFDHAKRPFILMNAVGLQSDVRTLLHESGHAFHVFEAAHLPYDQQTQTPMEFAEVASMAMELLASPYLPADEGGFYSDKDAARARVEHLEGILLFWPYMAVVDAFQHWVYTHHDAAMKPDNCDAAWAALWDCFMAGVDWTGLEPDKQTGWHRKLHIHKYPFYYVEYGLAQLGAVQVWRNALSDQAHAVKQYREALSLGGTATLPELFAAAGAKLAFDAGTLGEAVALIEGTLDQLDSAQ